MQILQRLMTTAKNVNHAIDATFATLCTNSTFYAGKALLP